MLLLLAVADKNKITMKRIYDRHSKPRSLKVVDKVLVLLPTSSSKIKAKWSGPFPLVEVLPNNNYKLEFGGRQAVLHINQLRTFVERESEGPPQTVAAIITSDDSDDQFSPPTLEWTDNADDKTRIGEHLTDTQRRQVEAILEIHAQSLTRVPGTTHLMQAKIKLKSANTECHMHCKRKLNKNVFECGITALLKRIRVRTLAPW